MRRLVPVAFLLICLAACNGSRPEETTSQRLLTLVATAKSRGESSIETNWVIERASNTPLDGALQSDSILIATPAKAGHAVIVGDNILTPQQFLVERWLSRRVRSADYCKQMSVPGPAPSGSVVAGIVAGTVIVQGVRISELTDAAMVFDPDARYLLFVDVCSDNRIGLSYGANSVFIVNTDGTISPAPYNHPVLPFVAEVFQLGTLNAFEAHLEEVLR